MVLARTFVSLPYLVISLEVQPAPPGDYRWWRRHLGAARHCLLARDHRCCSRRGVRINAGVARSLGELARPNLPGSRQGSHPYPSAGDLPAAGDQSVAAVALSLLLVVAALVVLGVGAHSRQDRYQSSRS